MENLLIGGIAGVISRTCTAPIELTIIQNQNKYLPNTTLTDVLRKEGLKGLWKGNYVNSIRIFPQMSINYYTYKLTKSKLERNINNTNVLNFISGISAGLISILCVYPLDNIRSRLSLQTNNDHYKGLTDIIKKTKVKNLYNGLRMTLIGYTPYNALNFTFYDYFKKIDKNNNNNSFINQILCGGFAGSCAVTITYPTDLIRRRLQLQDFDKLVPKYNGIVDCMKKIYVKEGLIGFYRGLLPCYMKIFPGLAIQFYMIEKLNQIYSSI
jgi:solute carrier family 25 phosphate transporter 23/24/25/41